MNNELRELSEAYLSIARDGLIFEEVPPTEITGGEPELTAKGPDIFKAPKSTSGKSQGQPVGDYYLKGYSPETHGDVGMKVSKAVLNFLRTQPDNTFPGTREEMQQEIAKFLVKIGINNTNAKYTARIIQRILLDNRIIKDEIGMSSETGHRAIRIAKNLDASRIDELLG